MGKMGKLVRLSPLSPMVRPVLPSFWLILAKGKWLKLGRLYATTRCSGYLYFLVLITAFMQRIGQRNAFMTVGGTNLVVVHMQHVVHDRSAAW